MAQRSLLNSKPSFFPIEIKNFAARLLKDHPDAVAAGICALLVLLGWFALHFNWVGLAILVLSAAYIIGGYESAKEGLTTLFEEKELDVDLLMIVAALGAAGLGFWRGEYYLMIDGAILILIFAISGALESYAMKHTQRNIRSLMAMTPDTARVVRRGKEEIIPVEQLQVGDRVIVKPGELIPTDAIIVEGCSALNQSSITGESMPVEKMPPDEVFAGTINGNGALQLEVHQPPESSLIQRVIRLVRQAQTEAPPSQLFIERFGRGYAKIIVIVGILLAIAPPFLWRWNWESTIYRALIFLVVASPCALMASIMPTLLSGIANGARQGILFKTGAQLELMGKVKAIAFDKTGTLTTGKLQVAQIIPAPGQSENRVLAIAATLESFSEHPIGEAIVQAAQQQRLQLRTAQDVRATAGQGITGDIAGKLAIAGKVTFIEEILSQSVGDANLRQRIQQLEAEGNTVIWVAYAEEMLGAIAVADALRPTAATTLKRLKQLGIEQIVMLTGDNQRSADRVAQQLGVDRVYAELLPEDKVRVIEHLQKEYQTVAMVGDGINDAPALAMASVGIAMGGAGTDVALETADIVLMADRLEKLEVAIRLGRRSQRIVKQNITFALSFIVVLLIANFMVNMTMPLGVIGHEGSTVLVTLSGLRLLRG
ncbi:ATPase [Hydrococcus rivularis NIES-593]|uniref:ATPase n=1 Tax=Hydrococcus rivularis NIES-593 TaxID=1921803 RepID=A0A1U7HRG4_9CYAN|nr:heavy metal translocating P-type ATPase [Hydrococcus rivularis]OKH26157.1 ATPase [Hydrococcus rivularis NIES-593]